MFRKFLSVITAVYIALLGMGMFVGCGNIDTPSDPAPGVPNTKSETFYAYDPLLDAYEDEDYITITESAVVWYFNDVVMNAIEFGGNVIFSGDKFTMTLEGSFSVLDTCTILYRGEREGDGVLRIDSTVITTYSELVAGPIVTTDNNVMYYCKTGSKPTNPVLPKEPDTGLEPTAPYTITLNGNGGKFDGQNTTTVSTDKNGFAIINVTPTRDGYVFKGYNTEADGSGDAITSATVFTKNTTVYAVWVVEVTVTFMDGNTVFATKKLAKGDALGSYSVPQADGKYFMGWYSNNVQYVSTSPITEDITLTAKWRTQKEVEDEFNEYLRGLVTVSLPGHVYVHYWRYDHQEEEEGVTNIAVPPTYNALIGSWTYLDWVLYSWPKNGEGRFFNAAWIDMSGAVYDIDRTYTFTDCGWDGVKHDTLNHSSKFDTAEIGIMITQYSSIDDGGFWANDGGNIYWSNIDKYNHVFYIQGNTRYPVYYSTTSGERLGEFRFPSNPYA